MNGAEGRSARVRNWAMLLPLMLMLILMLTSGCGVLRPTRVAPPTVYVLEQGRTLRSTTTVAPASDNAPTLLVVPTRAAAGYDTQHIIYVQVPHQRRHFAHSAWIDTPARMVAPLIIAAVEGTGRFSSVVPSTLGISGNLQLDSEVTQLQQDFSGVPSQVHFTLRATLSDTATRRVIAGQAFAATVAATSDDPAGGVEAANRAVQGVMEQLASFCGIAAERWTAAKQSGATAVE